MLRSIWGWISGSRIAAILGTVLAVLAALFAAHRKGVSDGAKAERTKTKADNRDAIAETLRANNDAATARTAASILADHEHTRIAATLATRIANPAPTEIDVSDLELNALEDELKRRPN